MTACVLCCVCVCVCVQDASAVHESADGSYPQCAMVDWPDVSREFLRLPGLAGGAVVAVVLVGLCWVWSCVVVGLVDVHDTVCGHCGVIASGTWTCMRTRWLAVCRHGSARLGR